LHNAPHDGIGFHEDVVVGGEDVDVGGAAVNDAVDVGGGESAGRLAVVLDLVRANRVAGQLAQSSGKNQSFRIF
jgi:hypothetical protein